MAAMKCLCCKLAHYLTVINLVSAKPTLDLGSEHTPLLHLSQYLVGAGYPSFRGQSCLDTVNVKLLQGVLNVQLLNIYRVKLLQCVLNVPLITVYMPTEWYILCWIAVFMCGMPCDIKMANDSCH